MNDLEKAAVAYAYAQSQGFDRAVECEQSLKEAARAYAASLSDFGLGLDPAPHGHFEDTIVRFTRQCFGEIGIGDPPRGWQWRAIGWSFEGHELVDVGSIELGRCGQDSVQWELRDCSFRGVALRDPAPLFMFEPGVPQSKIENLSIDTCSPVAPPPSPDPTAEALAREVLEAAKDATERPWYQSDGRYIYGKPRFVVGTGQTASDITFIVTACNAAETVSRAYLEAVGRLAALKSATRILIDELPICDLPNCYERATWRYSTAFFCDRHAEGESTPVIDRSVVQAVVDALGDAAAAKGEGGNG